MKFDMVIETRDPHFNQCLGNCSHLPVCWFGIPTASNFLLNYFLFSRKNLQPSETGRAPIMFKDSCQEEWISCQFQRLCLYYSTSVTSPSVTVYSNQADSTLHASCRARWNPPRPFSLSQQVKYLDRPNCNVSEYLNPLGLVLQQVLRCLSYFRTLDTGNLTERFSLRLQLDVLFDLINDNQVHRNHWEKTLKIWKSF